MMLGVQNITRRTYAAGAYTSGDFVRGASTDSTIRGTFRPMPERETQLLEGGQRARDPRVLYTTTELQLVDQHTGAVADRVSPDAGATWFELVKAFDGSPPAGTPAIRHHRYVALRVQETE